MNCNQLDENLALYLYGELPAAEGQALEEHLAGCAKCRALVDETRRLHSVLSQRPSPEPSPELLAHCRAALEEALDHELAGVSWKSLFRQWSAAFGGAPRLPIAAALTLVVFGFTLGWTLRTRGVSPRPAMNGITMSSAGEADLGKITAINQVAPSPREGDVRITVNAERQMILEGSLDDPRIRQLLVSAVTGYDNAGIRHDSMQALSREVDNPTVRSALLYAIQNDPNAGVRLDALQAAQRMEWGPEVRQAMLNTVEHDRNPGVRVAAIDFLADHADQETMPVLKRLAASDQNRYVRMRSATAVRKFDGD